MLTINIQFKLREETLFLVLSSLACLSFSVYRYVITDSSFLLFLIWNLFLAFVPYVITRFLRKLSTSMPRVMLYLCIGIWILFFPNAPYILTDLFHLRISKAMPIWYDLTMLLLYSWTGLMAGFLSLMEMEKILRQVQIQWNPVFSSAFLLLVSFGIYVGRYLRWNSWDLFSHGKIMIYDLTSLFTKANENTDAWGMTLAMAILLNAIYWSLRLLRMETKINEP